ncbi:hypothetical protein SynA1562_00468 [Synechococcus sp. A15-62]|nr:hypothetical protein SynA1562_00468 [Synechococcus sp. A15-62]
MGPFPGRLIHVSTGVMDGCRPSTSHTVCVDTRFMAQWMKSFRSCNTPITSVGWSAADQPLIPAPKKQTSTSKVRKLVEKLTPQKETSSNKKEKADSDKPEANKRKSTSSRRRNRRKQA